MVSDRYSVLLSAADAVGAGGELMLASPVISLPNLNAIADHPKALMQATPFGTNPASMDAPRPYPTRERTPLHVIEGRVRQYDGELPEDSSTYRAAVLLLAAVEYGQNLDLLARRTGLARSFVAKAARRLIDNGVWQGGKTVAEWNLTEEASPAFWNDVAVAEGKLCRRMDEKGAIEWAPAGFWNKSYQYSDAEAHARLDTVYHDAGRRPDQPIPLADERVADANLSAPPDAAATTPGTQPAALPPVQPVESSHTPATPAATKSNGAAKGSDIGVAGTNGSGAAATNGSGAGGTNGSGAAGSNGNAAEPADGEQPPSLMEIFSDAVWIR